jgi:hypothetical protein
VFGDCARYLYNRVLFDLTCQHGMRPQRPVLILVSLWLAFSIAYLMLIRLSKRSGLYVIPKRYQSHKITGNEQGINRGGGSLGSGSVRSSETAIPSSFLRILLEMVPTSSASQHFTFRRILLR